MHCQPSFFLFHPLVTQAKSAPNGPAGHSLTFPRLLPSLQPRGGGGGGPRCVHAMPGVPPSAVRCRYLPHLAYLCLCLATLNRKVAKYGHSLSSIVISSPWAGRVHAAQKPSQGLGLVLSCFRPVWAPFCPFSGGYPPRALGHRPCDYPRAVGSLQ